MGVLWKKNYPPVRGFYGTELPGEMAALLNAKSFHSSVPGLKRKP